MKNKHLKNRIIQWIFVCAELYFAGSLIFLYKYILCFVQEEPVDYLTYLFFIQNAATAVVLFIAYFIWRKQMENNPFLSPYSSLKIMSSEKELKEEVSLYNRQSISIGKKGKKGIIIRSTGTDDIYIPEYAVLNLVSGNWYIEALSAQYPIGIKKENDNMVYKLKTAIPYKLSCHDLIYIDCYKILIQ